MAGLHDSWLAKKESGPFAVQAAAAVVEEKWRGRQGEVGRGQRRWEGAENSWGLKL